MPKVLICLFAAFAAMLYAQAVITTIAESDPIPPGNEALVADGTGSVDVAGFVAQVTYRINPDATFKVVAGTGICAYTGDGGPARLASICNPLGLALDSDGNPYIADSRFHSVRRVSPSDGTLLPGIDKPGFAGDGGVASEASLSFPSAVAYDGLGSVYISEHGNRALRVVVGNKMSTIALTPEASPDPQPALGAGGTIQTAARNAALITGVAVDAKGNFYVNSFGTNTVYRVTPTGAVSVVAGNGAYASSGDNGPATQASIAGPEGLAIDTLGGPAEVI